MKCELSTHFRLLPDFAPCKQRTPTHIKHDHLHEHPGDDEIIYTFVKVIHSFLHLIQISALWAYFVGSYYVVNQTGTRFALEQLLLLALPLLLTLQALVELPPYTDKSHQLARSKIYSE
jgi:hypothetical protein|nr:MAG TPA: hypothetical protein [Caudoviricetes sp.]